MTDYSELIKAFRCKSLSKECDSCSYGYRLCPDSECNDACDVEQIYADAAAAIEALNNLVTLNTERCEGLRKQLREAQEQYEKHLNELEKELSFSESTYEEFQITAATQNALLAKQLPKRGEWVDGDNFEDPFLGKFRCSVCGHAVQAIEYNYEQKTVRFASGKTKYCPNCGAKMNGEQNVE